MSASRRLHIENQAQRNAVVAASSLTGTPPPKMGKGGYAAQFRRFVAAGEGCLDADLQERFGADYAQDLIDGDPEIDLNVVGRTVESTQTVLLSPAGEPIFFAPVIQEVSYGPDGTELERREPVETLATVNTDVPLRWTGRKMPKGDVVRRFGFRRTLQLQHVDGVTFDFLYSIAKELADEGVMVLLGAGEKGKDPLIMQVNGSPYRGFLEGRVNGDQYALFLHLSNMELKSPSEVATS